MSLHDHLIHDVIRIIQSFLRTTSLLREIFSVQSNMCPIILRVETFGCSCVAQSIQVTVAELELVGHWSVLFPLQRIRETDDDSLIPAV